MSFGASSAAYAAASSQRSNLPHLTTKPSGITSLGMATSCVTDLVTYRCHGKTANEIAGAR